MQDPIVVISGLSNTYSGYIATFEEYVLSLFLVFLNFIYIYLYEINLFFKVFFINLVFYYLIVILFLFSDIILQVSSAKIRGSVNHLRATHLGCLPTNLFGFGQFHSVCMHE
jgi:hypothetical protein